METDYCFKRHANSSHMQDHSAAKTITDRARACFVDYRLATQNFMGSSQSGCSSFHITQYRIHHCTGFIRTIRSRPITVHVDRQCAIPKLGQPIRARADVVIQAPPFVNNHHAGPWTLIFIVIGQVSL